MVCQRCQGLLVWDTFDDLNVGTDALCAATRCINCGYIEDAVVRANRFRRSAKTRVRSRRWVRTNTVERIKIHMDAYASIR
jgi:hypothetical protein